MTPSTSQTSNLAPLVLDPGCVRLAPDPQGAEDGCQILPGIGEDVVVARGVFAVAPTCHQAGGFQRSQARNETRPGRTGVGLDVVEPGDAEEQLPQRKQ